jgi:hypothetical protein
MCELMPTYIQACLNILPVDSYMICTKHIFTRIMSNMLGYVDKQHICVYISSICFAIYMKRDQKYIYIYTHTHTHIYLSMLGYVDQKHICVYISINMLGYVYEM